MRQLKQPRNPRYSIVIPAYNEQRLIGKCLDSLADQKTTVSYEVIVVDNNCTDETARVAREHGAHLIKEPNPGVCWARQAGLEAAKGEIIISTDADSTYSPNWLQKIDDHMTKEDVVAVGGTVTYTGDIWWANIWSGMLFGFSEAWRKTFGQPCYISACNLAFRKDAVSAYETNLTQGGDELAILKQLKQNGTVALELNNTVHTSGRRQSRGFTYNFFITFLWYYLLGYNLSRLTNKTVFGGYPAFRDFRKHTSTPVFNKLLPRLSALMIVAVLLFRAHPARAAHFIQKVPGQINNYLHDRDR